MNYLFRKLPVVVEAFQLTEATRRSNADWPGWMHEAWQKPFDQPGALAPWRQNEAVGPLGVLTLEGRMEVALGD